MGFYWIFWAFLAQLHYPSSLEFMGLPSTPYFLCFHYFGPAAAHSHFSTSYTAHGLLFLSFQAPLSPFTSSRPICLSHGLVIYYSYCLGLMGFLSICQLFSICVAGLLVSTWASKMTINSCKGWVAVVREVGSGRSVRERLGFEALIILRLRVGYFKANLKYFQVDYYFQLNQTPGNKEKFSIEINTT